MTDEQLPGELDDETEQAALRQIGLKLIRESVEHADDGFLAQCLAIYHDEWERRHGERWQLAPRMLRW